MGMGLQQLETLIRLRQRRVERALVQMGLARQALEQSQEKKAQVEREIYQFRQQGEQIRASRLQLNGNTSFTWSLSASYQAVLVGQIEEAQHRASLADQEILQAQTELQQATENVRNLRQKLQGLETRAAQVKAQHRLEQRQRDQRGMDEMSSGLRIWGQSNG